MDIAHLAHDVVGIGDDKVGESAVVFFEAFGALSVGLTGHLRTEISKLLAELLDFGLGFEVLKGTANSRVGEADGDGVEGAGVEFRVPLHDVKGTLRREGVIVVMDAGHDFAFFGVGVGGDGEMGAFDRSVNRFGSWCTREWDDRWVGEGVGGGCELVGWIDEGNGGGRKLGSDGVRGNGGLNVVEGGVGLGGRGHVELV